jgi:hypothetical protein
MHRELLADIAGAYRTMASQQWRTWRFVRQPTVLQILTRGANSEHSKDSPPNRIVPSVARQTHTAAVPRIKPVTVKTNPLYDMISPPILGRVDTHVKKRIGMILIARKMDKKVCKVSALVDSGQTERTIIDSRREQVETLRMTASCWHTAWRPAASWRQSAWFEQAWEVTTVSLESLPVTGIPDSLDCIIKDLLYVSDSDGGGAVRVDVRLDVNFGVVHVGGVSLLACCQGILLCR